MTRIHIDIDDTIADTTSTFIAYMSHKYKFKVDKEKLSEHAYNKIISELMKKEKDYFREFEKSNFFDKIKPVKNAQKVILNLAKNNELILISGRPLNLFKETKKWIDKYFPNCFLELHLVNQYPRDGEEKGPKKFELCKKLNCSFSVDDDSTTAMSLAELGIKVILFNQPWNKNAYLNDNIKRVSSWHEANNLVKLSKQ